MKHIITRLFHITTILSFLFISTEAWADSSNSYQHIRIDTSEAADAASDLPAILSIPAWIWLSLLCWLCIIILKHIINWHASGEKRRLKKIIYDMWNENDP